MTSSSRFLSGGEQAKTALVKLLVSDINVLLLGEPTNHLDIFTSEALEELLSSYTGTLLFVSHDRSLISSVATRILSFDQSSLRTFEGTLDEMEQNDTADRNREALELEITTLQMHMAAIVSRMSAPKKGDDPLQLNTDYETLSARLCNLKSQK